MKKFLLAALLFALPAIAQVNQPDLKAAIASDFGDTAVVTGTDDEISIEDGKKSTDHYVWTDIFVKRNGKWVAVTSQTAQIK